MIFNKTNNGSEELSAIVGSYYKSNDFDKVKSDIILATAELVKIIGKPVYDLAEAAYKSTDENPQNIELVPLVQLPIAILATFNLYRQNDVSHEDSGRKVKIDPENEKIPWEWQLKRDDEIQLDRYYQAVDVLISYLEASTLSEWTNSDQKKLANSLFIKNADKFDMYFPINRSGRMYMMLLPWIREAERKYIKPVLGDQFEKYLAGTSLTALEKEVLELIYPSIPLFAMSIAIRRMPLGVIPAGIIRNFIDGSQTMDASDPASLTEINLVSRQLITEAYDLLDDLKKALSEPVEAIIIPVNDEKNKYMRV
ncbi:MAG: DUF6712 family protein [Paludibacter sp.]|nr:DUF6712 family protein [Paludibacter sp.]